MYGLHNLKPLRPITATTVPCPVLGCNVVLPRQRNEFQCRPEFLCPQHRLYISPTTFEYENEGDNLLWTGDVDRTLLTWIKAVKGECRMARERSEDAVTWNVFRFLEHYNVLGEVFTPLGCPITEPAEVIYWSYSPNHGETWFDLLEARLAFKEARNVDDAQSHGSEPDLIIKSPSALLFIEAKFTASNDTTSRRQSGDGYIRGGEGWFGQVFASDYKSLMNAQKDELMRFWLLGTWIADGMRVPFRLISLVRDQQDRNIETVFRQHIRETDQRRFLRLTWEGIYNEVINKAPTSPDREAFKAWFRNKTAGYDQNGMLQRASRCEPSSLVAFQPTW